MSETAVTDGVRGLQAEVVGLAVDVLNGEALATRAQIGELALAWRREAKAASALPWGSPERVRAFEQVGVTCELFWAAVDAVLASTVPTAGES